MRRTLQRLLIPLKQPFVTSGGVVSARELVLLRLEDDDGNRGYGEGAPLEPYDGVALDDVVAALRNGTGGPPQARAAMEMAELDLEARRAGRSRTASAPKTGTSIRMASAMASDGRAETSTPVAKTRFA